MSETQFKCGRCGEIRAAEQYPPSQQHNGGYCRRCRRAYQKAHPRKRYKSDRKYSEKCYRCGEPRKDDDRAHVGYCRPCYRAYNRERYAANGKRVSINCVMCGKERVEEDGKHSSYCRKCLYIWQIQYKYGITPERYQEMLDEQGGGCAICGITQSNLWKENWNRPLEVDHCHDTGRVRGLLCSSCNVSLGRFKHDPRLLRRAADYLEES